MSGFDTVVIRAMFLSLLFFAMPMGLGNELIQPIASVLLLPFLFPARRDAFVASVYIAAVIGVSLYQGLSSDIQQFSLYQCVRTGLPFFWGCIILVGYKSIYGYFSLGMRQLYGGETTFIERVMLLFVIGQDIQVVLFSFDVNIANAALISPDNNRIFLFPSAALLLIFFYACYRQKLILIAPTTIVLLTTGSKTVIIAMLLLSGLALYKRVSLKTAAVNLLAIGLIVALAIYVIPTAIGRFSSFVSEENGVDRTREIEIEYAKAAFFSTPETIIIGNGFAKPLSPGVESFDPRWSENSK
jgi:hypothetical protein